MTNLWFDDIRLPPDGWQWARTIHEAKLLIHSNPRFEHASLDHDLGLHDYDPYEQDADLRRVPRRYKHFCGHIDFEERLNTPKEWCSLCQEHTDADEWSLVPEPDGVEFARWLRTSCPLEKVPRWITLHSMNPVGALNMSKELFNFAPIRIVEIVPYQRY